MLRLRNCFSSSWFLHLPSTPVPAREQYKPAQSIVWRTSLCMPLYVPFAPRISRFSTLSSSTQAPAVVMASAPHSPPPASPPTPPPASPPTIPPPVPTYGIRFKIIEKVKEEVHRFIEGSKQLGRNTKNAASLLSGVFRGHTLTRRERILLIRTVADLIRMVPFIVIVVVPFAEFCLPVLLKLFPNMLPSTFVSPSQKEAAQARGLQAKLEVIKVLQAASEDIVLRGKLASKDVQQSLLSFMSKVSKGEEISLEDTLAISKNFHNEFSFNFLEKSQLVSLAKFFGLPALGTPFILQEELKFKWNLVKKDDAHILREGIQSLSPTELEEAAYSRGYSSANTHHDKAKYLEEWIALSQENVPPYLLLLSRAHFFVNKTKEFVDIRPPIMAPYLPPVSEQALSVSGPSIVQERVEVDVPEKDIVNIEFKNQHHEFSRDPLVTKLWAHIAKFTQDIKKQAGVEKQVLYLGDSAINKYNTVITPEMRQYLLTIFTALDKDGDKKLSVDEVEHGMQASDLPVKRKEILELVRLYDSDGDGCLNFDEFVDCLLFSRKYKM